MSASIPLTAPPAGLLAALMRGELESSAALARCDPASLVDAARHHGVLPIVAERLAARRDAPAALIERCRLEAEQHAAADLSREVELRAAIDGLAGAGLDALVLKGAHLAYSYYPRPDLRPRDDTDVLVAPQARQAAHAALLRLGYGALEHVTGELVTHQAMYEKRRAGVLVHVIDLHWRIANPQLFSGVLTFDELGAASVPIPALSGRARGLAGPHALLLACVHRVAHHRDDDSLIWLYDIHLIASGLKAAEWELFLDLARERGVLTICRQGLARAAAEFGTAMPDGVPAAPLVREDMGREETAAFLRTDRAQFQTLMSDLRALSSWGERRQLLREHLVPPASYMRRVYAPSSRAPLPVLYAWRAVRGAWRWLARG